MVIGALIYFLYKSVKPKKKKFVPIVVDESEAKYSREFWEDMANQIHTLLSTQNVEGLGRINREKAKILLLRDDITDEDRAMLYNAFGIREHFLWGMSFFGFGDSLDLFGWIKKEFNPFDFAALARVWSSYSIGQRDTSE